MAPLAWGTLTEGALAGATVEVLASRADKYKVRLLAAHGGAPAGQERWTKMTALDKKEGAPPPPILDDLDDEEEEHNQQQQQQQLVVQSQELRPLKAVYSENASTVQKLEALRREQRAREHDGPPARSIDGPPDAHVIEKYAEEIRSKQRQVRQKSQYIEYKTRQDKLLEAGSEEREEAPAAFSGGTTNELQMAAAKGGGFRPTDRWEGAVPGMYFSHGALGLGYYPDPMQ